MDEYIKYFTSQNVYDYCNLNDNCYEVLNNLNKKYDVYICSAYVFKDNVSHSATMLKQKFNYLIKTFPFLDPKKFIFASDKKVINCDIKIDDVVDNLSDAKIKLLFTCYHNKNISDNELKEKGILRTNDWNDIRKMLL